MDSGVREPIHSRREKVELAYTYVWEKDSGGVERISSPYLAIPLLASAATWFVCVGMYGASAGAVAGYVFLMNLAFWAGTAILIGLNNMARNAYEQAEANKIRAGNYFLATKKLHAQLREGRETKGDMERLVDALCTPYATGGIFALGYYVTQLIAGSQLSLWMLALGGAIAGATIGAVTGFTAPVGLTQTCLPYVFDILATAAVGAGVLVGLHFTTPLLCSVLGVTSMAAPLTWLAQMGMAFPMVFAGKAGVQWLYNLGISEQLWGPNAVEIV